MIDLREPDRLAVRGPIYTYTYIFAHYQSCSFCVLFSKIDDVIPTKSHVILSPGFVLWPAPHSQMALHLLDLLFVEMRVPGTAFREHLLASNHLSLKR